MLTHKPSKRRCVKQAPVRTTRRQAITYIIWPQWQALGSARIPGIKELSNLTRQDCERLNGLRLVYITEDNPDCNPVSIFSLFITVNLSTMHAMFPDFTCVFLFLKSFSLIFSARRSYACAVLGIVILSVRPSVCPSHACFVTKRKTYCQHFDTNKGLWVTSPST